MLGLDVTPADRRAILAEDAHVGTNLGGRSRDGDAGDEESDESKSRVEEAHREPFGELVSTVGGRW